jgi:3',5'-cyclic AMP phosphodiesterase CpdA
MVRQLARLHFATFIGLLCCIACPVLAETITRGPYLQRGSPTSVVVRWRTDVPVESILEYGVSKNELSGRVRSRERRTDHEATLVGLTPHTKYYYRIKGAEGILAGGDEGHSFVSSPIAGDESFKIWVVGDSGSSGYLESGEDSGQAAVRDAFLAQHPAGSVPLFLMLGDNAYITGTDSEYQQGVFNVYQRVMRASVTWPTQGNHDLAGNAYYSVFTLPTKAESGGLSTGTEQYYSFDYAHVHCISLNSEAATSSLRSSMLLWLKEDLASHNKEWTIAFWHHPPYTKGSHDSDDNHDSEGRMAWMRETVLPLLESYGVDLVLSGHSHSYERSKFIDGHYGASPTFTAANVKAPGDGREGGQGAYTKHAVGSIPRSGAVFAVAGSSGKVSNGPLNHPAMVVSLKRLGSMVLDVNGNEMSAQMIGAKGEIEDSFVIRKDPKRPRIVNGVVVTQEGAGSARLVSWEGVPHTTSYHVYRSSVSYKRGEDIARIAGGVLTYRDTSARPGSTYYYSLRAENEAGKGPWSVAVEK